MPASPGMLPLEYADQTLGIGLSADDEELLGELLTRVLIHSNSVDLAITAQLANALWQYGNTAVYEDGALAAPPAPLPDWPRTGQGYQALHRAGISRAALDDCLDRLVDRQGARARLPRTFLALLVAAPLWPSALALLRDGPDRASARLKRMLEAEARRPLRATRSRPARAFPSRSYLDGLHSALRNLMARAVDAGTTGHPAPVLEAWTHLPAPVRFRGGRTDVHRPSPTLRHIRQVWAAHRDHTEAALGVPIELAARRIETWSDGTLVRRMVYRRLRNWTLLTLFLLVGGRVRAMSDLVRGSYDPAYLTREGERAPALVLQPRKSWAETVVRPKILPRAAAPIVEAYLLVVDRMYGPGLGADTPFWPGRDPTTQMGRNAISQTLSGNPPTEKFTGLRPIVPRRPELVGAERAAFGRDDWCGFGPHALRRFADETALRAARDWTQQHSCAATANDIAEILLDHAVPSDPYGYLGISSEEGRERYARIAIDGIWRLLATDEGARKVPDEAALREGFELRAAAEVELGDVRREIDVLSSQAADGGALQRRKTADVGALMAAFKRQVELTTAFGRERRVRDELAAVDHEIRRLSDPRSFVALPDRLADSYPERTPDQVAAELDRARTSDARRGRRQPPWITVTEIADIAEQSTAAARRWASGQALPHPAGDPRNPWEIDDIPVDNAWGPRRRRILVAGIKPTFFRTQAMRDKLEAILLTWPRGWGDGPEAR